MTRAEFEALAAEWTQRAEARIAEARALQEKVPDAGVRQMLDLAIARLTDVSTQPRLVLTPDSSPSQTAMELALHLCALHYQYGHDRITFIEDYLKRVGLGVTTV